MSDQLSKVGRAQAFLIWNRSQAEPPVRIGSEYGVAEYFEADRIESAAAPVEVGDVERVAAALAHESEAGWAGDLPDLFRNGAATIRTLARQLAEAQNLVSLRTDEADGAMSMWHSEKNRAEQAESQLAETTRRLGEVEDHAKEVHDSLALPGEHLTRAAVLARIVTLVERAREAG